MRKNPTPAFAEAAAIFRGRRGMLRTVDAARLGVDTGVLYTMRDAGMLEQPGRRPYRLSDISMAVLFRCLRLPASPRTPRPSTHY